MLHFFHHYPSFGREGAKRFWPKIIFIQKWSEMAKNWSIHFLSRIKVQSRGPGWDNLILFFLLFNLRWAQLYVSLVFFSISNMFTSLCFERAIWDWNVFKETFKSKMRAINQALVSIMNLWLTFTSKDHYRVSFYI